MICYLVRHGRDDESVRGGWSGQSLTEEGVQQAKRLAEYVRENRDALDIRRLYTSDLPRARQTAEPVAQVLDMPLTKTARSPAWTTSWRNKSIRDLSGVRWSGRNAILAGKVRSSSVSGSAMRGRNSPEVPRRRTET